MSDAVEPVPSLPVASRPAVCPRHPAERVVDNCSRCGDYLCLECVSYAQGQAFCSTCTPFDAPLAEPGARFTGRFVDNLVYLGVVVILWAVATAFNDPVLAALLPLLGFLACWGYNVHLLASSGQSIGKRAVGTRVVTADGQRVPVVRTVFWRTLAPLVISSIPVLGNLFGLMDACWVLGERRRCMHDIMASTIVVEAAASQGVYPDKTRRA